MKKSIGLAAGIVLAGTVAFAQNEGVGFSTNRVELWGKVQEKVGRKDPGCRYIENVALIPVTKRTTNSATALMDVLFFWNSVATNPCCLFMMLTEAVDRRHPELELKRAEADARDLGLRNKGDTLQDIGLSEETAFLVMEKLSRRMQMMEEEESGSFRDTVDLVVAPESFRGQPVHRGASPGIRCSRLLGKYLGKTRDLQAMAVGLRKLGDSRGYRFDVEIKEGAAFADFTQYMDRQIPVLAKTSGEAFFAVVGYLRDDAGDYLVVHDVVSAEVTFERFATTEVFPRDNIGCLSGNILPGLQFLRIDKSSGAISLLALVKWVRNLDEEKRIIRNAKEGGKQ